MSRVSARSAWLAAACLSMFIGFVALAAPSAAQAEDTVWICKPGQADDLCAGTISGSTLAPPGQQPVPLEYSRPADPPVDCFYLYPTQSNQPTPNSNLDKDPSIRRVVVQQARMFSSVCKVYAPMYRQVTFSGNQAAINPDVETAYASAKAAFQDYLDNYNGGRPFIMLGHSQGSAHTARLIDEMIDTDPNLRKRFVGAITPGANVYVPIGQPVGGMYENVPACQEADQYGCMVAFSMYTELPGPTAQFSRLDSGYWIYPEARPDKTRFEVMCVNPATLDGSGGRLLPLANFDYLSGVPASETEAPWRSLPDYYNAECRSQDGASWLNVSKVNLPGENRPDLGAAVGSGTNWHVPEVNLAEGNLLKIAGNMTTAYVQRADALNGQLAVLENRRARAGTSREKAQNRLRKMVKSVKKLSKEATRAGGKRKQALKRKATKVRRSAAAERRRIKGLSNQVSNLEGQIRSVEKQITALG